MNHSRVVIAALAAACVAGTSAQTPLGTAFTYQGRLENAGNPANGLHDLRFRLYDASGGGAQVGATVCADNVSVTAGLFIVPLDFGAQFAGQQRFLEIDVRADTGLGCGNSAGFTTLGPRQELTAAPNASFALNAATAQNATNASLLDGLDSTAFLQSVPLPLTLSGNSAPQIILGQNASVTSGATGVTGISTATTGAHQGVYGLSNSTSGRGVFGWTDAATGSTSGVSGLSDSTSGRGVSGTASAATGATSGVYGLSDSTSGNGVLGESADNIGVRGNATATTGVNYGIYGLSSSTSGGGVLGYAPAATGTTYGGYFQSNSPDGRAVAGFATDTTGGVCYGVYGQSTSLNGAGVYGRNTTNAGDAIVGVAQSGSGLRAFSSGQLGRAVSGTADGDDAAGVYGENNVGAGDTYGVYGRVQSTAGIGVNGFSFASTGASSGVSGVSQSVSGRGVSGLATAATGTSYGGRFQSNSVSGRGVLGYAPSTGVTYGVLGDASSSAGYGVFSAGDMGATGTKPFRIDHPDDPANKYLLHYAAESPEVINFYRGTVVLDGSGEAVVELPHYFAKINKTPSYQLTAIGAPMPMLHVAAKISEADLSAGARAEPGEVAPICSFRIAGGAPSGEVSWRVEAARNDRWVQQRGAPVEVDKQDLEKGTYQHPELYGQPPEKGMNYDAVGESKK